MVPQDIGGNKFMALNPTLLHPAAAGKSPDRLAGVSGRSTGCQNRCSGSSAKIFVWKASSSEAAAVRLGFQTRFTPPPSTALEIAYDQFSETPARMVFYRLGSLPARLDLPLVVRPLVRNQGRAGGVYPARRLGHLLSSRPGGRHRGSDGTDALAAPREA
jgi:hypothetical protein